MLVVDCIWNVMAHAQKPDFVFRRNGRVHLNRPGGRQFSRLLTAEVCESAVVTLDTPCSEVVWRVLATHSIRKFPPSRPPPPCVTVCHHFSTGLYHHQFILFGRPNSISKLSKKNVGLCFVCHMLHVSGMRVQFAVRMPYASLLMRG